MVLVHVQSGICSHWGLLPSIGGKFTKFEGEAFVVFLLCVWGVFARHFYLNRFRKKFDFFRLKSFVTAKVWLSAPSVRQSSVLIKPEPREYFAS